MDKLKWEFMGQVIEDGFYLLKDGNLFSVEPRTTIPVAKSVNVLTGEIKYSTNADRIRSMSDEELMRFLLRVGTLENRPWCDDEPCNNRYCSECITEWLKAEVKDG